jgi:hypothetical protein
MYSVNFVRAKNVCNWNFNDVMLLGTVSFVLVFWYENEPVVTV